MLKLDGLRNEEVFRNKPLTLLGKLNLIFGFFVILPFRVFLIFIFLFFSLPVLVGILFVFPENSRLKSQSLYYFLKPWGRSLLFLLGFMFIRMRGEKQINSKIKKFVVVSNHISWVDMLYLLQEYRCAFVAKEEVRRYFLLGPLAVALNTIFVDIRKRIGVKDDGNNLNNSSKGESTSQNIINYLTNDKESSLSRLCIFPEGTTSNGKSLLHFHKGAFLAGVPVLPVCLHYPFCTFDPAYSSVSLGFSILGTCCQFMSFLEVTCLPMHFPSDEEKNNPELFARNVRGEMAAALNIPVSEKGLKEQYEYLVTTGFFKIKSSQIVPTNEP